MGQILSVYLLLSNNYCNFATSNITIIMCTVTLSYNQNSALARRKLADLLRSGLFVQLTETMPDDETMLQEHRETRDAFLEASKRSMSHIIAKHL
ncbi:MAG: hypothetical protein IJ604_06400 [Prevotella sp.]|nr:hypothetical protein [Prevotella sp.]